MPQTKILSIDDAQAIPTALAILKQGGLVVLPTDTIYGVASSAFCGAAIHKLYQAKNRPPEKAIPVLIGAFEQIHLLSPHVNAGVIKLAHAFWPGALTMVIPRKPELPVELSAYPTVGNRMPDHAFTLSLLQQSQPLAVTSANISGGENPTSVAEVCAQLDGRVDLILDGGNTAGNIASTVVDCTQDELTLLRQGVIAFEKLAAIY